MSRFIHILSLSTTLLVICAACAFGTQTEIKYEKHGFSISLPHPFEKRVQSGSGTAVSEVFVEDGLGFLVSVVNTPSDSLTSTAIEQALQAAYKTAPKDGVTRRWEMNSRQKKLFKGISRTVEPGEGNADIPYINTLLNKKPGFTAISLTALGDESSPILVVGVVGPADKEMQIEAEAKGFAHSVKIFAAKSEEKTDKAPGKQPVDVTPVKMTKSPKPTAVPKPTTSPKPAAAPKPKVRPVPHKGQIELEGIIQSLDPKNSSFTMLVDVVIEPGHGTAKLAPARPKLVFMKNAPKEAVSGARVLIIGKSTGIGKPITAQVLEKVL